MCIRDRRAHICDALNDFGHREQIVDHGLVVFLCDGDGFGIVFSRFLLTDTEGLMDILHQPNYAVSSLVENLLHTRCHLIGAVLQFLMNVEIGAMMLFQLGFLVDEGDEIGAHVDNLKQKVNRLGDAAERGIHAVSYTHLDGYKRQY